MQDFPSSLKIALVQGTPILFDKKATVRKAAEQILEAGAAGAQLIVFSGILHSMLSIRTDFRFYRRGA